VGFNDGVVQSATGDNRWLITGGSQYGARRTTSTRYSPASVSRASHTRSPLPRHRESVAAASRDAQPQAARREAADGRAKAVARARDHDVGVSAEFRDRPPSSTVGCPLGNCHRARLPRRVEVSPKRSTA
jgi:hypothetical protein